ncbi:MAG TPA: type II restriction endonuclease, partial [Treponema sp.]|nr:type II restriction endonuclease [Treponema sp.]
VLRGRDIRRYGYEFADLYLIATFPSRHYNIEEYPAVKNYLLSFGIERLEQTGKEYIVNGEKIKARKKTNNKWFETQDSISYWDDFFKPKIVWKRVGSILRFSYDTKECLVLDSTCFAVGKHIKFLVGILNSKFGNYLLQNSPKTGTGDLLISVQAIEPIRIPIPDNNAEYDFENLINKMLYENASLESEIDQKVYKLYGLSKAEIDFIERQ